MNERPTYPSLRQFQSHPRDWRENLYVYPVISRRSRGLSIGVNLNPDTACNFDCIYCQVDRTGTPRVREVVPDRLRSELESMIAEASSARLYEDEAFRDVPAALRRINDLAFSGDGEPTTCPQFAECVRIAADVKRAAGLSGVKIVLITDACYLTRPAVEEGLRIMDANQGEVWAKLDAGTENYFRLVNRPNHSLRHVMENITACSRVRPAVIQSLFMRVNGSPPSKDEIDAYVERLSEIGDGGGKISCVQVYTVSRRPAQSYVTPLANDEVDAIMRAVVEETGLRAEAYYGAA